MKKFMMIAILCLVVIGASAVVYSQSGGLINLADSAVSVDTAKNNVKSFMGQPTADVSNAEKKTFPTREMYVLTANDGMFYVNAKTGEVQYALYEKSAINSGKVAMDLAAAEKIAYQFAVKKFEDFADKSMQMTRSELVDHGTAGKEYVFEWFEQMNGVYTLNTVQVRVNPETGAIISYAGNHEPVRANLSPAIKQENAVETAYSITKDIVNEKVTAQLRLISTDGIAQKLVYEVTVQGSWSDGTPAYVTVIVDATNGEIIPLN